MVMRGLTSIFVYLDNILVASLSEAEQWGKFLVFFRTQDGWLVVQPSKRLFGVCELTFLEHCVSADGIFPIQGKSVLCKLSSPHHKESSSNFHWHGKFSIIVFWWAWQTKSIHILHHFSKVCSGKDPAIGWSLEWIWTRLWTRQKGHC